MERLSETLGWQFSLGFFVGLVVGAFVACRMLLSVLRESRAVGYRGHTPPDAGKPILPQGGSGTATPTSEFCNAVMTGIRRSVNAPAAPTPGSR